MHRFGFGALALGFILSLATGCASRGSQPVTPADSIATSDAADDPSVSPPDESGVTFVEKRTNNQKTLGERSESERNAPASKLPTPNARTHSGTIPPATY